MPFEDDCQRALPLLLTITDIAARSSVGVPSHFITILEHTTWRVLSRKTRNIAAVLRSGAVSLHEVESLKVSRACSALSRACSASI